MGAVDEFALNALARVVLALEVGGLSERHEESLKRWSWRPCEEGGGTGELVMRRSVAVEVEGVCPKSKTGSRDIGRVE